MEVSVSSTPRQLYPEERASCLEIRSFEEEKIPHSFLASIPDTTDDHIRVLFIENIFSLL
jgi:hypothetical protein